MGNESSKPPTKPSEKREELLASLPSDAAAPKRDDAKDSFSPTITSRALLLQHLTTWIQCENDPSKQAIAERIEHQWQAEYCAFLTGSHSHLHPDGLALLVALYFPFNTSMSTDYENVQDARVLSNVQNEELTRAQAHWNLDAAEWINSDRNGKQKSRDVRKWEKTQQEEFQKWANPTKDSLLETDQIAFLQAIGFPLNGGGGRDDMNTASSVLTNKKRPRRNSTGSSTTTKKAKKSNNSSRARATAPLPTSRNSLSNTWSRALAMETDKDNLNEYSCMAREQLDLFCLTQDEVNHIRQTNLTKYKNRGSFLVEGQVGLRCKHCQLKTSFPGNLSGVNAFTTILVGTHFMKECKKIGDADRMKLKELKDSVGSQKIGPYRAPEYVAKCLQDLGIHEVPDRKGLFLRHETDVS